MSIAGLDFVDVNTFRGPIIEPQAEVSDIPSDASLLAENVSYFAGRIQCREGHEAVYSGLRASPYNWTNSSGNWLLALSGTSVVRRDLSTGSESTLGSVASASRASFQQAGNRVYMSLRDSSGAAAGEARVWDGNAFAKIAPAPLAAVPSVSQVIAGGVTAGMHRVAYIVQSASGYLGRPGPVVAGAFSPVEFTATGSNAATVSITATWPSWASVVWVLMTTAENPEKYFFVPEGYATVAGGTTSTVGVVVDCSDERLELVAEQATDHFFLATQDASGNGPISPTHCFAYSNRMVYLAADTAYFSDLRNYEALALDRNAIKLPDGKPMTSGGSIRGVCYLVGPSYTYSIQDTGVGDPPRAWPTPVLVSGSIGTPSPLGFAVNSDYGYAWVAAEGGLYYFDGSSYSEMPASYWQTPVWERINWNYAHLIEVVDHSPSQRVFVAVPLDGATQLSHILVFDYSKGRTHDRIMFSLDSLAGVSIYGMALVRNQATKRLDLWLATDSAGGTVARRYTRKEMADSPSTRYNDMGLSYMTRFRAAAVPTVASQRPIRLRNRAVDLRITGSGIVTVTAKGLDSTKSQQLGLVTLSQTPGDLVRRRFHIISPAVTYDFVMPVSNTWFSLSGLRSYYSKFL